MRRARASAPSDVITTLGINEAASLLRLLRLKKVRCTKDDLNKQICKEILSVSAQSSHTWGRFQC